MKKRKNQNRKLYTVYAENLPKTPWNVYPRPRLKRNSFFCLNGKWKFGVKNGENNIFDKEIIVPFSPESILSGVNCVYPEDKILVYEREFSLPKDFCKERVILHFGAVDQVARVYVNGKKATEHIGGYTPFSVDITPFIKENNTLTVEVEDHLSDLILPYGKQTRKPHGMWYTSVSGIWQTVWLESVPKNYVKDVKCYTDGDSVEIFLDGVIKASLNVKTPTGTIEDKTENGKFSFKVDNPVWWSPENPYLYEFTISTEDDSVQSYFALRTLSVKTVDGIKRLCLNGKPYFFHGLLDQGYWSDGLFLPATPNAYGDEIEKVKALGFNTLRKHIKIEPQIFYYECDKRGIIVWQDMINNGEYSFFRDTLLPTVGLIKKNDFKTHKKAEQRKAFLSTMEQTVKLLEFHPSICCWTIFNEGWGQFESDKAYLTLKNLDCTRFIDTTSGWFRCGNSDFDSKHVYFRKIKVKPSDKPVVVSEFGGSAYIDYDHVYNEKKAHGYGQKRTREEFVKSLRKLYQTEIIPAVKNGLCGAIYTQVSDIENETNGLVTYDMKVDKLLPEEFNDISKTLCESINKQ